MAEDTIDYKKQWERLKAELDTLNPAHDALKKAHEERGELLRLTTEKHDAAVSALRQATAERDGLSAELAKAREELAKLQQEFVAGAAKAGQELAELARRLNAAKALYEGRAGVITAALKLLSDDLDKQRAAAL